MLQSSGTGNDVLVGIAVGARRAAGAGSIAASAGGGGNAAGCGAGKYSGWSWKYCCWKDCG